MPSEKRLIVFQLKAKPFLGFETGSLRQNTVALPLAPPPMPLHRLQVRFEPMTCRRSVFAFELSGFYFSNAKQVEQKIKLQN